LLGRGVEKGRGQRREEDKRGVGGGRKGRARGRI